MNHNRIKNDFQNLPSPPPNAQKIQQTINIAQAELRHFSHEKELTFFKFLRLQIRFISYKTWLSQLILLCVFVALIANADVLASGRYELFTLLSTLAPIIAICGFGELIKSINCGMAEIESATVFSLLQLTIARSIIIAVMDLFCLTVIVLSVSSTSGLAITSFILYLLVPFLLTLSACLAAMNRLHSYHDNAICVTISLLCSALFFVLSFIEGAYATANISAWVIIFIGTIFYGIYEFTNTLKQLKGGILWNN